MWLHPHCVAVISSTLIHTGLKFRKLALWFKLTTELLQIELRQMIELIYVRSDHDAALRRASHGSTSKEMAVHHQWKMTANLLLATQGFNDLEKDENKMIINKTNLNLLRDLKWFIWTMLDCLKVLQSRLSYGDIRLSHYIVGWKPAWSDAVTGLENCESVQFKLELQWVGQIQAHEASVL